MGSGQTVNREYLADASQGLCGDVTEYFPRRPASATVVGTCVNAVRPGNGLCNFYFKQT